MTPEQALAEATDDPVWARIIDARLAALGYRIVRADAPLIDPQRLDAVLERLDEDDITYEQGYSASGEPMDPVLFVRWDAIAREYASVPNRPQDDTVGHSAEPKGVWVTEESLAAALAEHDAATFNIPTEPEEYANEARLLLAALSEGAS